MLPLTPVRCLHWAAEHFGERISVVDRERSFTYRELLNECCAFASSLLAMGVDETGRVAFLSFNTVELLEAYFAVPMIGAILVPLNARLSARDKAWVLNNCGASHVYYAAEFEAEVQVLKASCPEVHYWVEAGHNYEPAASLPPWLDTDEQSAAMLFYSSGSTGHPKGALLSHRGLYLQALSIAGLYSSSSSTVFLHTIPLFHASGWGHPQALPLAGATQILLDRFGPEAVFANIERFGVTDMCLVPVMARSLLASDVRRHYNLSSLRQILIGGAATSAELIEQLENTFHCTCYGSYGMTEAGPVLTHARPKHREQPRRKASAGWCVPNVELQVVADNGLPVAADGKAVGEIVVRSDHMMLGYWGKPPLVPGSWFHTGDLAIWHEDRSVEIVDRLADIIIRGGENISSVELEDALRRIPGVAECAVVAAPDEQWGEVPVAIVVQSPAADLSSEGILDTLASQLTKFKVPAWVDLVYGPLPKTASGKISKKELREKYWQGKAWRVQG